MKIFLGNSRVLIRFLFYDEFLDKENHLISYHILMIISSGTVENVARTKILRL